jgi:hypothetical protein
MIKCTQFNLKMFAISGQLLLTTEVNSRRMHLRVITAGRENPGSRSGGENEPAEQVDNDDANSSL